MRAGIRKAVFSAAALLLVMAMIAPVMSANSTSGYTDSSSGPTSGYTDSGFSSASDASSFTDSGSSVAPEPDTLEPVPEPDKTEQPPEADVSQESDGTEEAPPDIPQEEEESASPDVIYPVKGSGKGQANAYGVLRNLFKKSK